MLIKFLIIIIIIMYSICKAPFPLVLTNDQRRCRQLSIDTRKLVIESFTKYVGLKSGTKYLKGGTGADGNWQAVPQSGGIVGECASAVVFDASRRRREVI
jgi:hypothetical protein